MAVFEPGCPTLATVSVIGGKWKIPILYMLLGGPQRPSTLQRRLPGVNRQVLTAQLRELEQDQVVGRTEYGEVPPRVEYYLTEFGLTLAPALGALYRWGEEHQARVENLRTKHNRESAGQSEAVVNDVNEDKQPET